MLNVALTGNVASGKSTVVRHFAEWGATVIDADELVHEAQQPGTDTLAAIVDHFGKQVLHADGSLNRDALRRLAMGDDSARLALNAIVHPVVARRREELAREAAARGDCVLISDIPLLFEVLNPDDFDLVVLVDAPEQLRRERLRKIRGLSAEDADRLLGSQLVSESKRDRSDIVIDNRGTLDELRGNAWEAWRTIRAHAARAACGADGPFLAVLTDLSHAAWAIGGTLARYADAGLEAHLVLTAAAPPETDYGMSRNAAVSMEALQLHGVVELGFHPKALTRDDRYVLQSLISVIGRVRPQVMVTFGPLGLSGNADQIAVHKLVMRARDATDTACPLYFVALPAGGAGPGSPELPGAPYEAIAARIDIRPWHDVKEALVASLAAKEGPDPDSPSNRPPLDREWFAATGPVRRVLADLYEGGAPDG